MTLMLRLDQPSSTPLRTRLTETAEQDLAEVWLYLASEASEAAATRIIGTISLFMRLQASRDRARKARRCQ